MFLKKDNLFLGLALGILAPFLGLLGFYLVKFSAGSFIYFLQALASNKTLFSSIISVSLIMNAVVFTIYINTQKDKTARGVFAATCVYAIICIIIKFLL